MGLSLLDGLGPKAYRELLSAFGTPASIYATPFGELRHVVSDEIARQISAGLDHAALANSLAWLAKPGNHLVTLADSAYPRRLLEITDPPPLLYCKGNIELLNRPALAVVGSRNATPQGEKTTEEFARALSEHGYCVISGMALGIDGAAHKGALSGNGSTIAVIGTGLDIIYPAKHKALAHEIAEKGLIISEFSLGTPALAQNFPRRNRIISGLALGCLVVEANLQSGSLITARLAAEQGRDVFAIPGSIHSPVAKGCHQLIKQGAKLVDSIHDILEELGAPPDRAASPEKPAQADDPLLAHMGYDPVTLDALIERSGETAETLSGKLLMLELEGRVASLPGGRYQRIN
ncbi:MAG: DNA-processing protein DprA [Methylobacillus sp.]|nr:DNA-processing protein DprA [Methylobacillus sp.]